MLDERLYSTDEVVCGAGLTLGLTVDRTDDEIVVLVNTLGEDRVEGCVVTL